MTYAELAKERDDLKSENAMLRGIMDKMLAKGEALKEEIKALRNDVINAECNLNHVTLQLEEERTRTAKEIFSKLLNLCYDDNHPRGSVAAGELRYIAKMEYGAEVE